MPATDDDDHDDHDGLRRLLLWLYAEPRPMFLRLQRLGLVSLHELVPELDRRLVMLDAGGRLRSDLARLARDL